MKSKTKIKAGALTVNHNEKLVRSKKLVIKSGVRAGHGIIALNHNEKLVRR